MMNWFFISHVAVLFWSMRGSNSRPRAHKTRALPTELMDLAHECALLLTEGLEPSTFRLKAGRSTN